MLNYIGNKYSIVKDSEKNAKIDKSPWKQDLENSLSSKGDALVKDLKSQASNSQNNCKETPSTSSNDENDKSDSGSKNNISRSKSFNNAG